MKGKGIGPAPIIAVAVVSTLITLVLDYYGITTVVQKAIQRKVS